MSSELFNLTGKTALITGATHGIGFAIATGLAQAGARICVNDISDQKLELAAEAYRKIGIEAYLLNFDVTREDAVDRGISQIENAIGPVDILVNNAGLIRRVPILEMAVSEYREVLEVDLIAPFIVTRNRRGE